MYGNPQYASAPHQGVPSHLAGYEEKPLPYLPPQGPPQGQYMPQGQAPGYVYGHDAAAYGGHMHGYQPPMGQDWQHSAHMNSIPGGGMGIPPSNAMMDPQYPPHHHGHAPLAGLEAQMGVYPQQVTAGVIRGYESSQSPQHSSVSGYAGDSQPTASHLQGYEGETPAKKARPGPQGWTPVSSPSAGDFVSLPPKPAAAPQAKTNGPSIPAPPAKAACLACRARKARCDGQQPVCKQCISKGRECVFVKSRRGGARKKRNSDEVPLPPTALALFLKKLDSLLAPPPDMPEVDDMSLGDGSEVKPADCVRLYEPTDIEGLLTAYYGEIHPFQPLLPPMKYRTEIAAKLTPTSPFLLGLRTILALSPPSTDSRPSSAASKTLRRNAAAKLARQTSERIDEMLTAAGEDDDAPLSIEVIQALSLLGLYEFGQTGNAARNRMRMNQAVQLAMEAGLHLVDERDWTGEGTAVESGNVELETKRRTWWVVFAGMLISGLISGKRWTVDPEDPRIRVKFPACDLADSSWSSWLQSIRMTCQAMDLIMTLDFNMPNPSAPLTPPDSTRSGSGDSDDERPGMSNEESAEWRKKRVLHKKMVELDRGVLNMLQQAEQRAVIPLVPGGEEEVVRNQQLAASMMLAVCHIQLHRRQAFPEVALFSRKMCGLPKADTAKIDMQTPELSTSAVTPSQKSSRDLSPVQELSQPGHLLEQQQQQQQQQQNNGFNPDAIDPAVLAQFAASQSGAIGQDSFYPDFSTMDGFASGIPMDGLLWDPAIFPQTFPTPWFAADKGAASLYQPTQEETAFLPAMNGMFTAETGYLGAPLQGFGGMNAAQEQQTGFTSPVSSAPPSMSGNGDSPPRPPPKTHKAWGVDVKKRPVKLTLPSTAGPAASHSSGFDSDEDMDDFEAVMVGPDGPFPPGISLQRCATAAHSIVRLEVLHRSATMAMWKGPPKWLPFCACGLVSGAYAFLLLCLAIQAGTTFIEGSQAEQAEELEALWTNVKVILAGLEAYGQMWDGIGMMASEVKAALDAATRLPSDLLQNEGA